MGKGAFSNNTLTLTKQGGGSVDINFPEFETSVIDAYGDLTAPNIPISNITCEIGTSERASAYINYESIRINYSNLYAGGLFYKSLIRTTTATTDFRISTSVSSNSCYVLDEDVSFDISNNTFDLPIPNGNYKMIIDLAQTVFGRNAIVRKTTNESSYTDMECIEVNVNNRIATVQASHVILSKNRFVSTINNYFPTNIILIADRIIQV